MNHPIKLHNIGKGALVVSLLAVTWSALLAYEQGSFFLFDISESSEATSSSGRIQISKDLFAESETQKAEVESESSSDLEVEFNAFGMGGGSSITDDYEFSEFETTFEDNSSSFGTEEPPATGFFFTY